MAIERKCQKCSAEAWEGYSFCNGCLNRHRANCERYYARVEAGLVSGGIKRQESMRRRLYREDTDANVNVGTLEKASLLMLKRDMNNQCLECGGPRYRVGLLCERHRAKLIASK